MNPNDASPGSAEPQLGAKFFFPGDRRVPQNQERVADPAAAPTGWYSRGHLPHFDRPGTLQSITFRLADSLPRSLLIEVEHELRAWPDETRSIRYRQRIEEWLDSGMGCCALGHPALAAVIQETLLRSDGSRYRLIAWCLMPNHVHVLIETRAALSRILQSWKSFTGRWAMEHNESLGLGIRGSALWQREYWDRFIRDDQHYNAVVRYIEHNPVAAGLCQDPGDWPWSSARLRANS